MAGVRTSLVLRHLRTALAERGSEDRSDRELLHRFAAQRDEAAFAVLVRRHGALVLATAALMPLPVATILPLLFLATAFEIVFALHTGVERIGRYIQVFFEDGSGWEHTAMTFGRRYRPRLVRRGASRQCMT